MKTLIVGTGIIGVIYGWALSDAGVDVTHFVRKGKPDRFRKGVDLDLLDERKGHPPKKMYHYGLKCTDSTSLSDEYELVIVPVPVNQLEDALVDLAPRSPESTFLIFSGNWDGTEGIDRILPRNRYLLGYADGGGTLRNGVYWTNLGAEIHLGAEEGMASEKLNDIITLFARADIHPNLPASVLHWLWVHNAGVVGFAAGFAKHREVPAYLADRELLKLCILSTRELYGLCGKRGVDITQFPETRFLNLPVWLVIPLLRWNFRHNESMQRYTAHASSASSLRETKMSYAQVMTTATRLGYDMPFTRTLGQYLEKIV